MTTELTFLGTGNFIAPGRYWNSFVIDGTVLVEPSPAALPNLRRCGLSAAALDVVVISHFHADHTFGWPFLLLEIMQQRPGRPLHVVGPPGVKDFLTDMLRLGGLPNIEHAASRLDLRFTEVDGTWQQAGSLRYRAVEVQHVPHLRCFGYLFALAERTVGYTGDTAPCAGLDELAAAADVLVVECNGPHAGPRSHMEFADVSALRERFPDPALVLTHIGTEVEASSLHNVIVPDDFDVLSFGDPTEESV